jgi:hypothetical protein
VQYLLKGRASGKQGQWKKIDSNVFKALLALKKDPDRVILSADKGNCVLLWTNMIIARRLFHCCITEIRILFSSLILLERLKEV